MDFLVPNTRNIVLLGVLITAASRVPLAKNMTKTHHLQKNGGDIRVSGGTMMYSKI